jgi:hypothetical protein
MLALRTALVVAVLCAAAPSQADPMYKWVDEKGITHFSSDPPPDGKGQKIDVKPMPPSSTRAPQRPEDWSARASEMREQRLQKEKKEEDARREAERDKSRCLSAQDALEQLRSGRRLYTMNERGERVYMDENEHAAQTAKVQGNIQKYCPR